MHIKHITNGSVPSVLVFSHFPTVMRNGVAFYVCVLLFSPNCDDLLV